MIEGILGRKLGMTQLWGPEGKSIPVTVIEARPGRVLQVKTPEQDGYAAAQVGFGNVAARKVNKPMAGHFAKGKVSPARRLSEFGGSLEGVGQSITVEIFQKGEHVDVVGVSKGKGFQGVMKRLHYSGGPATHGSMFHRQPGSIGASSFPSRVWKNKGLPGQMGAKRVTVQGLEIVEIRPQDHLLFIRGAVPGPANGWVTVRRSRKGKKRGGGTS